MAIIGIHSLIYSKMAEETRDVFKALGWPHVDAGDGWLIFAAPPAELAVHPAGETEHHELYLMCDDIEATVAELQRQGIPTTGPVTDRGWGLLTAIRLPSGAELGLYEPRHPMAIPEPRARVRTARRAAPQKPAPRTSAARKPAARKPAARKPATKSRGGTKKPSRASARSKKSSKQRRRR
jgi:hypothetical protein